MKVVRLTQDKVALVDDADFEWLNQRKWHFNGQYACRTENRKTIYMHKLLVSSKSEVDHKDGDGLNNQRSNLRECTSSQNNMNMKSFAKSGFKGVYPVKGRGIYQVKLGTRTKKIFVGNFVDILEAARAYNKAAIEHYGEFARLNNVPQR